MEFQTRGTVHFHYFFEREALAQLGFLDACNIERVNRRGRTAHIVRGALDALVRIAWLGALEERTEEAEAFNAGGIVELLGSSDGAARYVAKEGAKRAQKQLPEGVDPCGSWWYLSPVGRPVARTLVRLPTVDLAEFPWKHVFDGSKLPYSPQVLD